MVLRPWGVVREQLETSLERSGVSPDEVPLVPDSLQLPQGTALLEQMDRELNVYGIKSWKWYCHSDPGHSGGGFQLDDDNAAWFYEESRKRGLKTFSVHKGYSYQSRTLGHLANPKDVEKAALNNPDLNFIIYHSAIQHGPGEPEFKERSFLDATSVDL